MRPALSAKLRPATDWLQHLVSTLQGYCQFVVAPKVAKFRSKYLSKLIKA
jgi:hypothetical protein